MENQTNLSSEQINSAVSDFEKERKEGATIDEMIEKRFTPEQADAVRRVLADPQKVEKILSSPLARRLMESIKKKGQTDG